jgi:hypothetical protein
LMPARLIDRSAITQGSYIRYLSYMGYMGYMGFNWDAWDTESRAVPTDVTQATL